MCAIIFKSEQHIREIPVNWKTGIDLTVDNADDLEKVAAGGPPVPTWGKKSPVFMAPLLKLPLPLSYLPTC
jgi:hypothetical protein